MLPHTDSKVDRMNLEKKPFDGNRIIFDEGLMQTTCVVEALGCQFGLNALYITSFFLNLGSTWDQNRPIQRTHVYMLSPVSDSSNHLHKSHRAKQMPCDDGKMSCQICLCEIFTMYHLCDMKSVTLKV